MTRSARATSPALVAIAASVLAALPGPAAAQTGPGPARSTPSGTSVLPTGKGGSGPILVLPTRPRVVSKAQDKVPVPSAESEAGPTGGEQPGTGEQPGAEGSGEAGTGRPGEPGTGQPGEPGDQPGTPPPDPGSPTPGQARAPADPAANSLLRKRPSDLNAALLPPAAKRQAAGPRQCVRRELINPMPSLGTRPIAGRRPFPWVTIGLIAAAAAALLAVVAVARRRHRAGASTGALEVAAATVGILGGLAALAGQFYGVGHKERPPPQATATVREVYARIPFGEYLRAMGEGPSRPARGIDDVDRRELGNVVWLELGLTGYGDADEVRLEYASFGAESGSGQLPATDGAVRLPLERRDHQKQFFPVWVGLPTVRYQVQFRLVDPRTDAVQALASTGAMRGEKHRFVCKRAQS